MISIVLPFMFNRHLKLDMLLKYNLVLGTLVVRTKLQITGLQILP